MIFLGNAVRRPAPSAEGEAWCGVVWCGVVVWVSLPQACVLRANTNIIKPSNARDGAGNHATLPATDIREPA
jgi:hypothetical protein